MKHTNIEVKQEGLFEDEYQQTEGAFEIKEEGIYLRVPYYCSGMGEEIARPNIVESKKRKTKHSPTGPIAVSESSTKKTCTSLPHYKTRCKWRPAHSQHTGDPCASHTCEMGESPHAEPKSVMNQHTKISELLLDLESESEDEELIAIYLINNIKTKSLTNAYLRDRSTHGEFKLSQDIPEEVFKANFRLSRDQFDEVHEMIKSDIIGGECNAQKPIGSQEKLAVCLRFFATGDLFKTIALSYKMGERTVSNIVSEVSNAIWLHLQPIFMPVPTVGMWESVALDFERKWHVYNCIGTIGRKHVAIRKPLRSSGSSYFNYKQYCPVVLMATVDAHYRFINVDVGSLGRFSDGGIFSNSCLGKMLLNGSLELPQPKPLPGQDENTPYVFIGDEAFPLMSNLMRLYSKNDVTNNYENKVYNDRISNGRQTVECAFGMLSSRFCVYKRAFECKLETVDKVILATTVLHNYLRRKTLSGSNPTEEDELMINRTESNFSPLSCNRTTSSKNAFLIREKFKKCFNSVPGSVEWQRRAVERGKF